MVGMFAQNCLKCLVFFWWKNSRVTLSTIRDTRSFTRNMVITI